MKERKKTTGHLLDRSKAGMKERKKTTGQRNKTNEWRQSESMRIERSKRNETRIETKRSEMNRESRRNDAE